MEKKLQLKKGNSFKIKATFAFVVSILFFGISNEAFSQTATATWNLTSNGNASVTGAVTATSLAIGSSISNATYGNTNGVTTNSWANDGSSLNSNEYYEYEVTPTAGNKLTISSVTLNHSISTGNWLAAVYYSFDGFATAGVQIGSNFSSSSTSQTALNLTGLSLAVPTGGSFSIRVYAWDSDGSNRNFRNRNVVITGTTCVLPAISTQPLTQGVCLGSTLNLSVTATNATSYQWKKAGVNIGGATTSSYSISNFAAGDAASYTVDVINSCQTVTSNAAVITANAAPSAITIAPTSATVCSNEITSLVATGGIATGVSILNENFNNATNNWTLENTSTGGTVADAAWKLRPNSYGYDIDVFNSNDNSQFYLSNSDDQGTGSTTSTRLISPVIDLTNCTAATLSFYHYYRSATGDTAKVQISTNGGATWSSTDLASYSTLQGVDNAFAFVSISLNSFVGNNNVKIRFNYSASWDWYWAIDNVSITASKQQVSWSPITGLYTDSLASIAYTGGFTSTVYAKLTSNSSFTATSTSPAGCTSSNIVNVTVNPNVTPTFTAVAPICSGGSLSALPTTSNNGITGTWSPALSNTATNTYTFTPTSGQCATSTTLTITVNPNVTYYRDFDTDGFGDLSITQISCTGAPSGYVANSTDCDDNDISVYQSALLYTDVDGDGHNVGSAVTCYGASLPAGTSLTTIASGDCDDNNNLVYQSALLYSDVDGDGYNVGSAVTCYGASLPAGTSLTTIAFGDCNDNNNLVYQSALLYTDVDGDGYNVGSAITCYGATLPAGTSLTTIGSGDCNDNNNLVYQTGVFYVDFDGDNYATSNTTISLCYGTSEPNGYSAINLGLDCDDTNSAIFQTGLFYVDADGDNYSTGNTTTSICYGASEPNGYSLVNLGLDCDDTNGSIFQTGLFYVDADADNYSTGTSTISLCYGASEPNGYSAINLGLDCDDTIAAINPGQAEILYNGFDDNCDGNLDEGFQITTPMMGCGSTITVINSLISAVSSPAIGITGYRFEVTKLGSNPLEVQVIDRPIQYFSLTQLSKYSYAATYSIRCMLQRNGVWLGYYGPACNISSPAVLDPGGASSITPSQCGITLPTINTLIATTSLAGATGYKFKVTNTRTGFVQELPRTLQWFSLTMLAQYVYGDTYTVEVAVKTTGDYTGYGSPCEVTAPVVPSLISQCNTIIAAKTTNVATSSLAYVSSYDFEVRNMTTLATANVSNNLNWFRLNMLTNYAPNTQFRVRVRLLSSGVYSDYGDACFITSPAFARTQEVVVDKNTFEVTASPNPFDTNFGMFLNATSTEDVSIRVYDMIGKLMEQRLVKATEVVTQEVGNNYPSGVYNVIVSQGAEVKTLRMIKR